MRNKNLRIIAGSLRGLRLCAPDTLGTRPTSDRVKEALFSIIQLYMSEARVLDLFAGSGALGLEALSRGAAWVDFVDNDGSAIDAINKNVEKARLRDLCRVIRAEYMSFLNGCPSYDVIFLDPPYNSALLTEAADYIHEQRIVTGGGILVCEGERGGEIDSLCEKDYDGFETIKTANYGKRKLLIFRTCVH